MRKFLRLLFILIVIIAILIFVQKIGKSNSQDSYDSKKAIKRGDIVATPSKLTNFKRFEEFLLNISEKKEDRVRITSYTLEGDPIFKDLSFDGKEIHYKYDPTYDEYGENKVETDICVGILKRVNDEEITEYYLHLVDKIKNYHCYK